MKLVAVIGSRKLPASWAGRVSRVVTDLVRRGCRIGSGKARGTDLFALQAVVNLRREACEGSRIFLPGSVMRAPSVSREWLPSFEALGGSGHLSFRNYDSVFIIHPSSSENGRYAMKSIRSFLQHELNSLHVFSRLCRVMGKRRAMAISMAWEQSRLYRVIYA